MPIQTIFFRNHFAAFADPFFSEAETGHVNRVIAAEYIGSWDDRRIYRCAQCVFGPEYGRQDWTMYYALISPRLSVGVGSLEELDPYDVEQAVDSGALR